MSSTEFDFEKQKALAREFDRKMIELRRKLYEPSLLGGGMRTNELLEALRTKTENLLEEARAVVDQSQADIKEKNERCQEIRETIQAARSDLDQLRLLRGNSTHLTNGHHLPGSPP